MKTLSEKQDKNGLPAAPPPNRRVVPEGTAAPDPTAVADPQEQDVQTEASPDSGSDN